jgi:hypothetical protein
VDVLINIILHQEALLTSPINQTILSKKFPKKPNFLNRKNSQLKASSEAPKN